MGEITEIAESTLTLTSHPVKQSSSALQPAVFTTTPKEAPRILKGILKNSRAPVTPPVHLPRDIPDNPTSRKRISLDGNSPISHSSVPLRASFGQPLFSRMASNAASRLSRWHDAESCYLQQIRRQVGGNQEIMENILSRCNLQTQARCLRVNYLFFEIAGPLVYKQFDFFNDYVWRQELAMGYGKLREAANKASDAPQIDTHTSLARRSSNQPDFQRDLLKHVKVLQDSMHDECANYRQRLKYMTGVTTLQVTMTKDCCLKCQDCPQGVDCPILTMQPTKLVLRNLNRKNLAEALTKYRPIINQVQTLSVMMTAGDKVLSTAHANMMRQAFPANIRRIRLILTNHQRVRTVPLDFDDPATKDQIISFLVALIGSGPAATGQVFEVYFLHHHWKVSNSLMRLDIRHSGMSYVPEISREVIKKLDDAHLNSDTITPTVLFKTAKEFLEEGVDDELNFASLQHLRQPTKDQLPEIVVAREPLPFFCRV